MGMRTPGYQCHVRDWYEPLDPDTSALTTHRPPPGGSQDPHPSGSHRHHSHAPRAPQGFSLHDYQANRRKLSRLVPVALLDFNEDIVQMVFADPVASTIAIDYAGVKVGPSELIGAFYKVRERRILAFYDHSGVFIKSGRGGARYVQQLDVLFVGPRVAPLMAGGDLGIYQRSVVLHELLHAALDGKKSNPSQVDEEKAAAVFQATYLRLSSFQEKSIPDSALGAAILKAALDIVDKTSPGQPPTAAQDQALEKAIRMHPDYLTVFLPIAHDGIR